MTIAGSGYSQVNLAAKQGSCVAFDLESCRIELAAADFAAKACYDYPECTPAKYYCELNYWRAALADRGATSGGTAATTQQDDVYTTTTATVESQIHDMLCNCSGVVIWE